MNDLVPEPPFNGVVRIVKLISGEELLGIVRDVSSTHLAMILPARIEVGYTKDEQGVTVEYVKLTNYAANIQNNEILLNHSAVMFMGNPTVEMMKMYETFFAAMKADPDSIKSSSIQDFLSGPEPGLDMLNELFNNEDFVNFVNDLIDSFEGENVLNENFEEEEISEEGQSFLPEPPINDPEPEESPKPPKRKKRSKIKPETNQMPFNPDANPNSAESWSDNPQDYL